ncbi:Major facilitator superfamily domain-containing protein 10 [Beauveria bassiana D1-5]|uniref:Major facilitator superfamily domain-containing protein 10 n=1 Tax=Beauveria bassiana D1-5 TaxID=1245745 RepID=A0A0A2VEY7_BEABA|nr:Major facilitator superfamily domain-containing protein 10 [Beauveria bassiana D1-5]
MDGHSESEPLLLDVAPVERRPVPRRTFWRAVLLSYAMLFCSQLYASSFNTVLYETLEGLLCRDMYDDVGDPLADPRCKGEAVQSELSLLTSIEASFEMFPPMLCGIVYGLIADVYGRRPILILSTFGAVLYGALDIAICWFHDYVHIKFFWAVPIVYFFTGGGLVAASINYTVVADVSTKSQRSAIFLATTSAFLLGAFFGAYLAAALLPLGHYFAMCAILSVQILGLCASCFVPETITIGEKPQDSVNDAMPFREKLSAKIAQLRVQSLASLRDIFWGGNTKLTLLLMSTLFTGVGKHLVSSVMKQYAVKRYELSWANAGIILSYANLVRLALCFAGIPLLVIALRKAKVLPIIQDAWISRVSVLVAVTCSCLAGAAPDVGVFTVSVILYAFSSCLEPTVRSLVVAMGRDAGTGSIISALEVLTAVSIAIAGPVIAATFRLGMRLGGGWIGLPMYIGGGIMVPGALILLFMRFDEEVAEELAEESEGLL